MSSVSALAPEGEIEFNDNYVTASTSTDNIVWLDIDMAVRIPNPPSGTMVMCWDWDGDGTFTRCWGASQYALDECAWVYPELENICYSGDCSVDNLYANHYMWTKRSQIGNNGESDQMKAKYYVYCDIPASRDIGVPTNNGERYYILSNRHYDCNSVGGTYADEGYYGNWFDRDSSVSCGAGYGCDERLDGGNANFGYYGTSTPSAPCSKEDGQGCSSDSECLNSCSPGGTCVSSTCGDNTCESGEWCISDPCQPAGTCGGNPDYCNTCNSNQCASDHWYTQGASKYCFNRGELCCGDDPTFGQYYCRSNDAWLECSSGNHNGCQQQGNYYCTTEGGVWRWRQCSDGCDTGDNGCYTPVYEPDIDVSPTSLTFEVGY